MRSKRILSIALIFPLIVCLSCSSQNKLPQLDKYNWFSFQWYADSVSGRYFDKLALMLPVGISNLKGKFIVQFDLGSNSTDLYGNCLKNYFNSRQELLSLLDTSKKMGSGNDVHYRNKDLVIKMNNYSITDLWVMDQFGTEIHKDSLYTNSDKLVGTIGADFTKNKVLIIDYPNRRMSLLDSMDSYWASKATYVECLVKRNRIHIPVTINGKEYSLLFDTGASIFPISTDYDTWKNITDTNAPIDTLNISSWGEKVNVYGANIKYDVYLGKQKLNKGKVYYNTNKRLLEFNKQENIAGTTGNAYFYNDIVIIDFTNKKFGVVN